MGAIIHTPNRVSTIYMGTYCRSSNRRSCGGAIRSSRNQLNFGRELRTRPDLADPPAFARARLVRRELRRASPTYQTYPTPPDPPHLPHPTARVRARERRRRDWTEGEVDLTRRDFLAAAAAVPLAHARSTTRPEPVEGRALEAGFSTAPPPDLPYLSLAEAAALIKSRRLSPI